MVIRGVLTDWSRATGLGIALVLMAVTVLSGCDNISSPPESTPEETPINFEAAYAQADAHARDVPGNFIGSTTALAEKLFVTLAREEKETNLFISPLSVSIAMGMMMNGASGQNLVEMQEVLELAGFDIPAINQSFENLILSLETADKQMDLSIANSLWLRDSFAPIVKESFTDSLSQHFDAEVHTRDFDDVTAKDDINAWVGDKTAGRIPVVLNEPIPSDAQMYLINALYFNAEWSKAFDTGLTRDRDFSRNDGTTVSVPMMRHKDLGVFYTYEWDDDAAEMLWSAVRLPYGRKAFALYAIMSEDGDNDALLDTIEEKGLGYYFHDWNFNSWQHDTAEIRLPRFSTEYSSDLVEAFETLGMSRAFGLIPGERPFLGIEDQTPQNIMISRILHKANIEVDEVGTEAAAVTVIEAVPGSAPPQEDEFVFNANRPFIYLIMDERNNTILFMGRMEDPTEVL